MSDILNSLPEDTEENGYPRTEHYLQMDVFKGISGLIDRNHFEHAQAWATLELAEVNYRAALAAERQAAALERIADLLTKARIREIDSEMSVIAKELKL